MNHTLSSACITRPHTEEDKNLWIRHIQCNNLRNHFNALLIRQWAGKSWSDL